ncbi:restriction alleviation protein, Lar family [Acutalibacter sp. 1XD8-33]|uniref:Lar family restriction alleviation protein n=1 Tax=Acutalibacter sp. 1XD8-33 TaxID=2320081 RepID=UPI000EA091DB|nr:restriction alleviation protein, Lar family [Acutalibacter sp. 1XD8-33]
MVELKSCPFCGGKAVVKTSSNSVDHCGLFSQLHSVSCSKCGATTSKTYKSEFRRDIDGFHVIHDGYEEAATDWNRRATE